MRSDTRKRSVPKVGRGLHRQKLPVQHCHFEATSTASSRRDLNPANVAPSLLSQVVHSSCSVCSLRTLRPLDAPSSCVLMQHLLTANVSPSSGSFKMCTLAMSACVLQPAVCICRDHCLLPRIHRRSRAPCYTAWRIHPLRERTGGSAMMNKGAVYLCRNLDTAQPAPACIICTR